MPACAPSTSAIRITRARSAYYIPAMTAKTESALRQGRRRRPLQGRDPDQQRRGRRPRVRLRRRSRQHRPRDSGAHGRRATCGELSALTGPPSIRCCFLANEKRPRETAMNLVERAKNIVLQPNQEWPVIAGEATDTKSLFVGYAMPLAAIPSIAAWLGHLGHRRLGRDTRHVSGADRREPRVGHSVLCARPRQRLRAGPHHRRSRAFLRRREEQPFRR